MLLLWLDYAGYRIPALQSMEGIAVGGDLSKCQPILIISFEYLTEEKFYPLGTTDEYFEEPYEEYPITVCGNKVILTNGEPAAALADIWNMTVLGVPEKPPPALDVHRHVLLYIKKGLKARLRAFSPVIIIEDQYFQTFIHALIILRSYNISSNKRKVDSKTVFIRKTF